MKLRYIIATLAAAAALFTGCKEEGDTYLNEIKVSSSYVGIPMEGGEKDIKVNATEAWEFVAESIPEWLTVAPLSGAAGESSVKFSADETFDGRTAELQIACAGRIQRINIIQGLPGVSEATVKQVNEGPEKQYRVTGVVTKLAGEHYGNMYINDGTVEGDGLYIYGTLDRKGNEMKSSTAYDVFNSGHENAYDIAVGDKVTIEGPKVIYNGTIELKNVAIINIEPALVKVIPMDIELDGPEAGDTLIKIASKAESLKVKPNDDWLYVKEIENTADTVFVRVGFFANEGVVKRTGTLSVTGKGFKDVTITIVQGANAPALMTIADALQSSYVHVKGKIMAICKQGYIISDATGSLLVYYGSTFDATQFKLGDEMEIIGDLAAYNFGPQLSCANKAFDLCEKVSEGTGSVTYPTPKVLDAAACDEVVAAITGKDKNKLSDVIKVEYVQVVGTLKVSGNYTNIYLDDYTANDCSAYQLPASFNASSMHEKKVTVRGYLSSVSGSSSPRHLTIVFTSLEEGAAEEPEDYLLASFAESVEGFTWEDVSLPAGSTYVWKYDATNHYLKASSYFSGAKHASESIAVSPEIDLTDATHAYLSFQHVGKNFASVESLPDMISAEVKVGETWHKLAAPKMFSNADWTWVGSGDLDMSEYVGNKVRVGFRYVSTDANCGTWEVKEVKVCNYTSE